jgi:hypothetical protein
MSHVQIGEGIIGGPGYPTNVVRLRGQATSANTIQCGEHRKLYDRGNRSCETRNRKFLHRQCESGRQSGLGETRLPRHLNGQLKYCRSQVLTGTHFRSTVCLTPDEISATDGNTKSDLNQLDRAGRAICPNNKCD